MSAPTKKDAPSRDIRLDKTRPTNADISGRQSRQSLNRSQTKQAMNNVSAFELKKVSSAKKSKRSVSCESNSPSFGNEISELIDYSVKSDQASIADWLELLERNEHHIGDCDIEGDFFQMINKEQLASQSAFPVIAPMVENDSVIAELDRAFIYEHS